jgi:hypothetical protein
MFMMKAWSLVIIFALSTVAIQAQGIKSESGSSAGNELKKMKEDFERGANDTIFLLNYFNALPEEDTLKSLVAERYLLVISDEMLKSEKSDDIIRHDKMINKVAHFNEGLMYRMLRLFDEKLKADGNFDANYNIGIVFSIELLGGKLLQQAIDKRDMNLLEKVIKYKTEWNATLKRGATPTGDGDYKLRNERGIFFASPELIRLEYLKINKNDPEKFKAEIVPYLANLIATYPVESMKAVVDTADAFYKSAKEKKMLSVVLLGNAIRINALTIDYIIGFSGYFWRISPNDEKTKMLIAKWLNYACALNPYYIQGVKKAAPLFVRVGHPHDAIKHLENSYTVYNQGFASMLPQWVADMAEMQELITDIKNGKL